MIQPQMSSEIRIVRRMTVGFLAAGVAMGLIFPPVASFFVTVNPGMLIPFFGIAIMAGLIMGTIATVSIRLTVVKTLVAVGAAERQRRESLVEAFRRYVSFVEDVGRGNLSRRLGVVSEDDLGILARHLDKMVESLAAMHSQLVSATHELGTSGAELLSAATQQSTTASEQATAVSETTTTMEEVRQTAEQTSERAQAVIAIAEQSEKVSEQGIRALGAAVNSITELRDRVTSIAQNILVLSEKTQQIGEIIATVNELAEQSNLLAVNASIEAAKAGEHGKGFAVVASEVRNLAEQSKQATRQVRTILGEIQRATNAAVLVTEDGAKKAEVGVSLSKDAAETIRALTGVIQESTQAARQIASLARQQALGVDQVTMAMRSIQQASRDALGGMGQVEKAAKELNLLSGRMKELTKRSAN